MLPDDDGGHPQFVYLWAGPLGKNLGHGHRDRLAYLDAGMMRAGCNRTAFVWV